MINTIQLEKRELYTEAKKAGERVISLCNICCEKPSDRWLDMYYDALDEYLEAVKVFNTYIHELWNTSNDIREYVDLISQSKTVTKRHHTQIIRSKVLELNMCMCIESLKCRSLMA